MSKTINITDAKNELFQLIDWVAKTKDIVLIERGDMIVARLAPINKIEEKDIRKTFRLLN